MQLHYISEIGKPVLQQHHITKIKTGESQTDS